MKKIFILLLFIIPAINTNAQVTSLDEHFDNCIVVGGNYPTHWTELHILPDLALTWNCGPTEGRGTSSATTSPGITCNNFDGVGYFLDTAWLFTPQLNLSFYSGNIYLQFDTRYLNNASRLALLISDTYQPGWSPDTVINGSSIWTDLTSATTPVLGNTGTNSWVTHIVDLTPYKTAPVYVAFRYTANTTGSGKWIIDNVRTTQTNSVPVIDKDPLSLNVLGNIAAGKFTVSYTAPEAATYQLSINDILGREVYKGYVTANSGPATYTIDIPGLHEGMYLVKMGDGTLNSTVKTIAR